MNEIMERDNPSSQLYDPHWHLSDRDYFDWKVLATLLNEESVEDEREQRRKPKQQKSTNTLIRSGHDR